MSDESSRPAGRAHDTMLSRLVGVVISPRDTFERIAARPCWAGMLLLIVAIPVACSIALLSTEIGREALLDRQVIAVESLGLEVTDQQYETMRNTLGYMPYLVALQFLLLTPTVLLAISGMVFGIFNSVLAGNASFKQVFAIVTHASSLLILQQLFVTPLNYARGALTSATNLTGLMPFLDEGSVLAHLLGVIDLFYMWWIVLLGLGVAVLYRRRARPIVIRFLAAYGVVAVVIAAAISMLGAR